MNKLNVKALGLTLGIVWGIGMLFLGLMSMFWNFGTAFVSLMGTLYIGYNATFLGTIIGAIWGFCDGAVFGVLIAWIYNRLSKD